MTLNMFPKGSKRHIFVDFLAAHPVLDDSPLDTYLSNEMVMTVHVQKRWEIFRVLTKDP